jgi:hypothetical protein
MIYAIESEGRTIALTDDASAIHKINTHGPLTRRWANESERARFRELASRHERRWWLRDKINAALCWLWRISFPPMRKETY